jgi:hypothetical protein
MVVRSIVHTVHQLSGSIGFSMKSGKGCPFRDVFDWIDAASQQKEDVGLQLD